MRINLKKLTQGDQLVWVCVDLLMIALVIVNLTWLVFDALFSTQLVQQVLSAVSEDFTSWYRLTLHAHFFFYDLIFVAIFAVELSVRWVISIVKKTYHRWWFYPFVHWYDVLGCIPVGSFRFLRLLRIVSILYRLQRIGVIDLSTTFPAQFFKKYTGVVVEEISDRVVVNVLEGVKEQVQLGNPLTQRIAHEIIMPRESLLSAWVSRRVTDLIDQSYEPRKSDVQQYVSRLIIEAFQRNNNLLFVDKIPFMGNLVAGTLETVVSDVVYQVLDQLVEDLHGDESTGYIREASNVFMSALANPEGDMSQLIKHVVMETIDLVIEEVQVQKWKLSEE